MEQPLRMLAEDEVVAVTATEGDVGEGEVNLWCQQTARLQLVGGLNASRLNTDARQPGTGRAKLIVVLVQGCGIRELTVVEDIVGRCVDHVHAQPFLVEVVDVAIVDVARQRVGAQVVDVEADLLSVVLEVGLVVVVVAANLSGVDRERGGNVAVVHLQSHGVVGLGVEVVLRVNIVHSALGVDVVAGLVA